MSPALLLHLHGRNLKPVSCGFVITLISDLVKLVNAHVYNIILFFRSYHVDNSKWISPAKTTAGINVLESVTDRLKLDTKPIPDKGQSLFKKQTVIEWFDSGRGQSLSNSRVQVHRDEASIWSNSFVQNKQKSRASAFSLQNLTSLI